MTLVQLWLFTCVLEILLYAGIAKDHNCAYPHLDDLFTHLDPLSLTVHAN